MSKTFPAAAEHPEVAEAARKLADLRRRLAAAQAEVLAAKRAEAAGDDAELLRLVVAGDDKAVAKHLDSRSSRLSHAEVKVAALRRAVKEQAAALDQAAVRGNVALYQQLQPKHRKLLGNVLAALEGLVDAGDAMKAFALEVERLTGASFHDHFPGACRRVCPNDMIEFARQYVWHAKSQRAYIAGEE